MSPTIGQVRERYRGGSAAMAGPVGAASRGAHVAVWLLVALLGPCRLAAQTVAGVVRERTAGRPVAGALVTLLGAGDTARARSLTRDDGGYTLSASAAGVYRLRVERIGYEATTSPPLHLAAGDTLIYDPRTTVRAVSLSRIVVRGKRRCVVRPAEGEAVATAWDEARKALEIARSTSRQHLVAYDLRTYRQRRDPNTLHVLNQKSRLGRATGAQPFSSLPAGRLLRRGFVGTTGKGRVYYAPDPGVLLSNAFLGTHCFRLAPPQKHDSTLIGLHFEPVRHRNVADITGTFWLDRRTDRLETLRFHYTDALDRSVDSGDLGGYEAFEALPSGAWIIRRWWIRAPQFLVGENRWDIKRVYQIGGEVTDLYDAGAARLAGALRGITGDTAAAGVVVADSLAGAARVAVPQGKSGPGHARIRGEVVARGVGVDVPGAAVALLDSAGRVLAEKRSGSHGDFVFGGLGPGTYAVRAEAPGFLRRARAQVLVQGGGAEDVTLWLDPQPLTIPKLQVQARRRDETLIQQEIGMNVTSLDPSHITLGRRLQRLEQTSNSFADLLRKRSVPGLVVYRGQGANGPCFQIDGAVDLLGRPICAEVYVDGILVRRDMLWTVDNAVGLGDLGAIVVLRASQAGAMFGTNSSGGVVLIYTREGMGLRPR